MQMLNGVYDSKLKHLTRWNVIQTHKQKLPEIQWLLHLSVNGKMAFAWIVNGSKPCTNIHLNDKNEPSNTDILENSQNETYKTFQRFPFSFDLWIGCCHCCCCCSPSSHCKRARSFEAEIWSAFVVLVLELPNASIDIMFWVDAVFMLVPGFFLCFGFSSCLLFMIW